MKIEIFRQECWDWSCAEPLAVDCYPWGGSYRPKTTARVLVQDGIALRVKMDCQEKAPKRTYTEQDSPVYRDSCMECFLNLAPEENFGYLNLECNANGALYVAYGKTPESRTLLRELGLPMPAASVQVTEAGWTVDFTVPFSLMKALYHKSQLLPGDEIAANFYKCGDETAEPHYGCWQPVQAASPDFHRPDCFGKLIVAEE